MINANIHISDEKRYVVVKIGEEGVGRTVHSYLKSYLHCTETMIRRIKRRQNGVLINGEYRFMNAVLTLDDELWIRLYDVGFVDTEGESNWADPPETMPPLRILYEDEDLLFVEKGPGVCCHPSPGHYADTLSNQIAKHLGFRSGRMFPVGRLDMDTSGIVLFAKNQDSASIMTVERENGNYDKTYLAWVDGIVEEDFVVNQPIRKIDEDFLLREVHPDGLEAQTYATVVRCDLERNRTLLSIKIEHGRTHQIRVHMAYSGHPICGDVLYNPNCQDEFMKLQAYKVTFRLPYIWQEQEISVEEDLSKV